MACFKYRHESSLFRAADGDRMPFAEPGVGPSYAPDRAARIDHIEVHLRLFPEKAEARGQAWIRWSAYPGFSGQLALDLDEVLVDAVEDADGHALSFTHADGKLLVNVPTTGGTVVVQWEIQRPRRGLYFTGPTPLEPKRQKMAWTQCQDEDAHFVLPCFDHPSVKHPWTIELEGPKGYTLLGNGEIGEAATRGDRHFVRFEQRDPMPAYLFTAVCARLEGIESEWRGRPVRYFAPVGEAEALERAMGRTPQMIEVFSQKTGFDYPWPRYDQVVVHDFIFGGMENTACTTMTRALLVDEQAALDWDPEALVAHELAHQWFGDLVTCQDWSQGWLNESWATFMETVWEEAVHSPEDTTWYRYDQMQQYLDEDSGRYRRPIVCYQFREPIDVFDRHLYEKGAVVLATLRTMLGEDAFWTGTKLYLHRHAHSTVHTRHFQRALEDATGRNLDRFFDQWIYSPGHPELSVNLGKEPGLVVVTVKQTQSGDGVPEVYHLPLRIELRLKSGENRTIDLPIAERDRTWAIPVDVEQVVAVRVDPGFRVLASITLAGPEAWMVAALTDSCPVLATRAAKALLASGTRSGFRAVADALVKHAHPGARGEIAAMVAKNGGPDALDALLETMNSERDARARRRIIESYGKFKGDRAGEALVRELSTAPTPQVLGAALLALAKTRDPRAKAKLIEHLDYPSWSSYVSQRAIEGLAELEDPTVLELVIDRSRAENAPDRARGAAARTLAKLGDKHEALRAKAYERLTEMTEESAYRAQIAAVAALGNVGEPKGLGVLSRLHQSAPDGRTRRVAYEAMVRLRKGKTSEASLATLHRRIDALTDENHALRKRLDKIEHHEP